MGFSVQVEGLILDKRIYIYFFEVRRKERRVGIDILN